MHCAIPPARAGASRRLPAAGVLAGICLLATVVPGAAAQVGPLTEREAVALALGRGELAEALDGRQLAAQAEALEAGLWPNPQLEYEREQRDGRAAEQSWRLSQALDLAGRRALRREAAETRTGAVQAEGAGRRAEVAAAVRRLFFSALHAQSRAAALRDWEQRILAAEDTVTRLAAAGEASGYERRRVARERVAAQARLAAAQAESLNLAEQLAAQVGRPVDALQGELLPEALPALEPLLERLARRPELQALEARARASDLERRAAERAWVPEPTLGAGVKRIEEPDRSDSALLLSVAVPLPLFDRGQAADRRAAAEALALRGELGLARERTLGELRGRWRQAQSLREAALRLRAGSVEAAAELARVAQIAYRAGESGVLELLDAYRTLLDARAEGLDLELSARLAGIDIDLLTGEYAE